MNFEISSLLEENQGVLTSLGSNSETLVPFGPNLEARLFLEVNYEAYLPSSKGSESPLCFP